MSLVAEQLIGNEDITGWKVALKEIHAALNKQVIQVNVFLYMCDIDPRRRGVYFVLFWVFFCVCEGSERVIPNGKDGRSKSYNMISCTGELLR